MICRVFSFDRWASIVRNRIYDMDIWIIQRIRNRSRYVMVPIFGGSYYWHYRLYKFLLYSYNANSR